LRRACPRRLPQGNPLQQLTKKVRVQLAAHGLTDAERRSVLYGVGLRPRP
jgi:hypothetical protein